MKMRKQKVKKQKVDEDEDEDDNDDDETMSQNEKNEIIKAKNNTLDEIIDKSKSFDKQITIITFLVIKS